MHNLKSKITTLAKLLSWRVRQKKSGKKIVFTNGCFDILHAGHITLLEKAKGLGSYLVVGLNSDNSVRRIKGAKRPINNQKDRAYVLAGLAAVDFIIVFGEDTPYKLLSKLKPDILVKGADYKSHEVIGRQFAGKVITVPLVKGKSTSKIISKISKN